MKLVIVESPAKARTIEHILGEGFVVESSIGHIRDIPASAKDTPESLRDEWRRTRFGVDVDNGFKPLYVVSADKKKQVTKLKQLVKKADVVYLATDEDREGEAIAWHLLEVLSPRVLVQRMVFHEITASSIQEAIDHPRDLDRHLVDAQEARRILDRLYGYEVSPVLWKKVRRGLSAGRVQSPAIRIVVERERERMAFVSRSYWDLAGTFSVLGGKDDTPFKASLLAVDDKRVASGRDFSQSGDLKNKDALLLDAAASRVLVAELDGEPFSVSTIASNPYKRKPYPPFRTATLQQESGRKLRFGARRTMASAQRLYEDGFITYMRTDSITLSESAVSAARSLVASRYGDQFLPAQPRVYRGKVKNAQEAHEAIRPAGDVFTDPQSVAAAFGPKSDEARVYDLIWKRTVASQMKDAHGESIQVRLDGRATSGRIACFGATGKTVTFPGFLRAYVEGSDDPDAALDDQERHLPTMAEDSPLAVHSLEAKGHDTRPPNRYTEAALIKRLEELGIGRPSTYAQIISTIQDRGYVFKRAGALIPTFTALAAVSLMEQHFGDLVDYEFSARMENDLDEIASGNQEALPWLTSFYFGNGHLGLKHLVYENLDVIDAQAINSIALGMDAEGEELTVRVGQYGPYVRRGEDTVTIPEDVAPDELTLEKASEFLAAPKGDRVLGVDASTDLEVITRSGRFGPYVQLGKSEAGSKQKPKTAALFSSMSLDTVTLEQALLLLAQPRIVGEHPSDGEPITAQNGRYGPYIKWIKETRSLETEDQIFSITLEEAVALLAQPKARRGQQRSPLRELGNDPNSGAPVIVRTGRYGPYVTDGEYNASLKTADLVETLTLERAAELLQERRVKGPKKRKTQ